MTTDEEKLNELTPVQLMSHYDKQIWVKRDDLFEVAGCFGGKARTCFALSRGAKGLVTAGSRKSPQVNLVAHMGKYFGVPAVGVTPHGAITPEIQDAINCGMEHVPKAFPCFTPTLTITAKKIAEERGFTYIPFGMECEEAVKQTAKQVQNIPPEVKRIVMPVGSAMSLAGVLTGLREYGIKKEVLGVCVGANPYARLQKYAPYDWKSYCKLVFSEYEYDYEMKAKVGGVTLDPIYEAKCAPYLEEDDMLWIVGCRNTVKNGGV